MTGITERRREFLTLAVNTGLATWFGIFLIILIAGGILVFKPIRHLSKKIETQIDAVRNKRVKVESVAQGSKDFGMILKLFEDEYQDLMKKTLRPGEQSKVISSLTQVTEDLNITILSIKPLTVEEKTPKPDTKLKPVFFEMQMACRYRNLGLFLERFTGIPIILTVEEFDAKTGAADSPMLNVRAVLAAYEEALL